VHVYFFSVFPGGFWISTGRFTFLELILPRGYLILLLSWRRCFAWQACDREELSFSFAFPRSFELHHLFDQASNLSDLVPGLGQGRRFFRCSPCAGCASPFPESLERQTYPPFSSFPHCLGRKLYPSCFLSSPDLSTFPFLVYASRDQVRPVFSPLSQTLVNSLFSFSSSSVGYGLATLASLASDAFPISFLKIWNLFLRWYAFRRFFFSFLFSRDGVDFFPMSPSRPLVVGWGRALAGLRFFESCNKVRLLARVGKAGSPSTWFCFDVVRLQPIPQGASFLGSK